MGMILAHGALDPSAIVKLAISSMCRTRQQKVFLSDLVWVELRPFELNCPDNLVRTIFVISVCQSYYVFNK